MRKVTTALGRCAILLFFLFTSAILYAQQGGSRVISGKVNDENNAGLVDVTVAVKAGNATTTTKADGTFTITVPETARTLTVSYAGYLPQEITITGADVGTISLRPDPKSLDNVVVVGYGTRKKTEVTGAVASISGDNLRTVQTTNLTQALQGRLPGVVATPSSFRPGSGSAIRIRGNRSLSASNDPLYVVDGFPVSYTIDDINPADIETIDVLKDASATAIYGVRGANGVIQITTRKGRAGKISVNYQGSQSIETILRKQPVFDGAEIADAWRQAFFADTAYTRTRGVRTASNSLFYYPDALNDLALFKNRFGSNDQWNSLKDAYTWATYDPINNIYIPRKRATTAEERTTLQNLNNLYRSAMRTDSIDIYDPSKINSYDWGDNVGLRNGQTTNHNISVTAGSDKIKASFSGGYFKQKGIEYAQDYTRYSVGSSVDFKPVKYLNFGATVSFNNTITNTSTSSYGNALGMIPLTHPYDSAGNYILFPNNDQQIINAVNDRNTVFDRTTANRIFGNVYAEISIFKGLKYRTMFGLDTRNSIRGTFNGSQSSVRLGTGLATASQTTNQATSWVYDNILTYNTKIGADHSINVTALQELQSLNHASSLTLSANNLIFESQKWYALQNNTDALVTGSGTYTASQYLSYMGRIEYGFKSKYLLTASARYDNSSVLAPDKQGAIFPAASIAWQIDKENFFANQRVLSYAKLRAGIGQVGNASISPYQTGGPLAFTNYNWGNGQAAIGSAPSTFRTPDLGWEKTTTTNLGLEFGLFRGRISGTIDLYKSTTTDLLQLRSIPAANGVTSVYFNLGKVSNKGVEISLSTQNINKGSFRWTTDWLFTANKEKIVDVDGSNNSNFANLWLLGQPLQVYWSYKKEGIFQYADTVRGGALEKYWAKNGRNNSNFQPGKIRIQDTNGDSTFSAADRVVLGSNNPDFIASIGNTLTYKNFDLNFLVYFRVGGLYRVARPGLVGRYQSSKVDYWTPTNPTNEYQQPTQTSDIPTFWEALTYRNATYVKVKNITLTYHIPKKIISKIYANNMAFYFSAVNPILIHSASPYDPETVPYREFPGNTTSQTGPTSYSYRSYVLGVKLDL